MGILEVTQQICSIWEDQGFSVKLAGQLMDISMQLPPPIIDVEASGFGRGSYPVEIGLALSDGSTHCFLIKPARDWQHWDPRAEQVHGIHRETLQQYGHDISEVAVTLNRMLAGMTLYSDAWGMDMPWVGKLFEAARLMPRFRIESLATLLDQRLMEEWHEAKDKVVHSSQLNRHRASHDALILQQTFLELTRPDIAV